MGHWTAYSVHTLISRNDFGLNSWSITDPTLLARVALRPGWLLRRRAHPRVPDGAVRAQLHLLDHPVSTSGVAALQEPVVFGSQIYGCTVLSHGSSPVGHARVRGSSC